MKSEFLVFIHAFEQCTHPTILTSGWNLPSASIDTRGTGMSSEADSQHSLQGQHYDATNAIDLFAAGAL